MTYRKNCLWLYGMLLSAFCMVSCSDEHETVQKEAEGTVMIQASVSAFKADGKITSLEGEDEIEDIQACLFENGLMTEVYTDMDCSSDTYPLKLKSMSGTLYMLANTARIINLQQMKEQGTTEQEWLNTIIKTENGKALRFFSGKLDLKEQDQGQTVLPMSLKHGTARFDLLVRAGGVISVKSLTLKNVAQESYLLPKEEIVSPEQASARDIRIDFLQPLPQDSLGVAYVCEQANPQLKVVAEMEMDGKTYIQEASLPPGTETQYGLYGHRTQGCLVG